MRPAAPHGRHDTRSWQSAEAKQFMPRALILVLDSVGIGGAPDAALYGDEGADTVGHIADACWHGKADRSGLRAGPLVVPNLRRLGLGRACELATGWLAPGLD